MKSIKNNLTNDYNYFDKISEKNKKNDFEENVHLQYLKLSYKIQKVR
jgi:hypothetical protein